MTQQLRYPVKRTPAGPVVLMPFLKDAWLHRDARYRRRRTVTTVLWTLLTFVTVGLSALYVRGLARSGTTPATVFATVYGLTFIPGLVLGRRWLRRVPGRTGNGRIALWGPTYFLLMPVFAGIGLAVLPALFGNDFPGEQKAREVTAEWRQ